MKKKRRLLILACSRRKKTTPVPLPAVKRYDGPLFFVLRRFIRECPLQADLLDVYVLSARYGLIPGDFPTPTYDLMMTPMRALDLQEKVKRDFADIPHNRYDSVCLVLGKNYLKAFESAMDMVSGDAETSFARGTIGKQSGHLKGWLRGEIC